MAMKKRASQPRKMQKDDDSVVYKAVAALVILCLAVLGLRLVSRYYPVMGTLLAVNTALAIGAAVFAVVALLGLLGLVTPWNTKRFWKAAAWPMLLVGLLLSASCLLLYKTWVDYIPALYFVYVATAVLYLIFLLYQHEFFLLSLVNVCAGGCFFLLSRSGRMLQLSVPLAVLIAAAVVLTAVARKNDGKLKFFGKTLRFMDHDATPLPLYVAGAVWLACLLAVAALGAVVAYYCVFAAVAFELIAAVYYTMKLS